MPAVNVQRTIVQSYLRTPGSCKQTSGSKEGWNPFLKISGGLGRLLSKLAWPVSSLLETVFFAYFLFQKKVARRGSEAEEPTRVRIGANLPSVYGTQGNLYTRTPETVYIQKNSVWDLIYPYTINLLDRWSFKYF